MNNSMNTQYVREFNAKVFDINTGIHFNAVFMVDTSKYPVDVYSRDGEYYALVHYVNKKPNYELVTKSAWDKKVKMITEEYQKNPPQKDSWFKVGFDVWLFRIFKVAVVALFAALVISKVGRRLGFWFSV